MDTTIIIAIIIVLGLIAVVFLLRDRLTELFVDGKKATMQVKAKANEPVVEDEDEPAASVVFTKSKLRGEGEYRMRDTNFSEMDIDGKQKFELGYDEPSKESLDQENP